MHLVSDLQRRPFKGRLKVEKNMIPINDLATCVQMVCFLVHTVMTSLSSKRTFSRFIFVQQKFNLSDILEYKTTNCTYTTTRNIYAFNDVTMTFTQNSINDVFVDNAIQMRLAIFICAVTLFLGVLNRVAMEVNFYAFKFRNFIIWKDIISATELLFLAYVLQIASAAEPSSHLLRDYLSHCGVLDNIYLPYMPIVSLWVFSAVGYLLYIIGLSVYLWNSLPKYGIMTATEIQEYKEWVRARKVEREKSRAFIEEAKRAHARMQLLKTADYRTSKGGGMQSGMPIPMVMMAPVPVMGPDGNMYYQYPYPQQGHPPGMMMMPAQYSQRDQGPAMVMTSQGPRYVQPPPGGMPVPPQGGMPRKRIVPASVVAAANGGRLPTTPQMPSGQEPRYVGSPQTPMTVNSHTVNYESAGTNRTP